MPLKEVGNRGGQSQPQHPLQTGCAIEIEQAFQVRVRRLQSSDRAGEDGEEGHKHRQGDDRAVRVVDPGPDENKGGDGDHGGDLQGGGQGANRSLQQGAEAYYEGDDLGGEAGDQ